MGTNHFSGSKSIGNTVLYSFYTLYSEGGLYDSLKCVGPQSFRLGTCASSRWHGLIISDSYSRDLISTLQNDQFLSTSGQTSGNVVDMIDMGPILLLGTSRRAKHKID